jgi:DNA invertase Pin-like site-specific DNA recombinase
VQQAAISHFADIAGYEIAKTFVEIETGSDDARPKLWAALKRAKRLKAAIVVARLDRLRGTSPTSRT